MTTTPFRARSNALDRDRTVVASLTITDVPKDGEDCVRGRRPTVALYSSDEFVNKVFYDEAGCADLLHALATGSPCG